jgi:hypothetical protein
VIRYEWILVCSIGSNEELDFLRHLMEATFNSI